MAKKKNTEKPTRGYSTTSIAKKKEPEKPDQLKSAQTSTSSLVEKQVPEPEKKNDFSNQDKLVQIKVDAELEKENSKKSAFYADEKMQKISLDNEVEYDIIKLLKSELGKEYWFKKESAQATDISKLNFVYSSLLKLGFSQDLIENAMEQCPLQSLQLVLDWIAVNVPATSLPTWFCEKVSTIEVHEHQQTSVKESVEIVKVAPIETLKTEERVESNIAQDLDSVKKWILYHYEQEDESNESVNSKVAMILAEQKQLKAKALVLKQMGNKAECKEIGNKLKQMYNEYQELIHERDYDELQVQEMLSKMKLETVEPEPTEAPNEQEQVEYDIFEDNYYSPSNTKAVKKYKPMHLAYTKAQWTGKSPKQYFMDWISRNAKGTSAKFTRMSGDDYYGWRYSCELIGGKKEFNGKKVEMLESELAETVKEAEHYAATKMLYLLLPTLPLHRSLPPPYRDVWLRFVEGVKDEQESSEAQKLEHKIEFLNKIAAKRSKLVKPSAQKSAISIESLTELKSSKPVLLDNSLKQDFESRKADTQYVKYLDERQKLPVFMEMNRILETISQYQVTIISGETGSGKTTQIPQFILSSALESINESFCNIICTQPRRISATSIASRVSLEMGDKKVGQVGAFVGYQIRFESCANQISTRLLFCTTGVLLRKMEQDPMLYSISHLIIDEVHERNIESDFLLLVLKNLLVSRPDLKIILMSATAEAQSFIDYFGDFRVAPLVKVSGRTFPVEQLFLEDAIEQTGYIVERTSEFAIRREMGQFNSAKVKVSQKGRDNTVQLTWNEDDVYDSMHENDPNLVIEREKYSEKTLSSMAIIDVHRINYELIELLIKRICTDPNSKKGSILVFLPGFAEIKRLFEQLQSLKELKLLVLPLHSVLDSADQSKVFREAPKGYSKVVLSTNIAETGITIPDVVYVIDTCRSKQVLFDDRKHIKRLDESFVSIANMQQRKGRAGRVQSGVCYSLVPSGLVSQLPLYQKPEIVRLPLEELCLRVKAFGIKETIQSFLSHCIDAPPAKNIERSVLLLQLIGALDDSENLTLLGSKLSQLPVDARLGRILLYGYALSCVTATCVIAATLSLSKTPFAKGLDQQPIIEKKFISGDSDLITMLNAYREWYQYSRMHSRKETREFCAKNSLSLLNLEQIRETSDNFASLLQKMFDFKESNSNSSIDSVVLTALSCGLYPNTCQYSQSQFSLLNSTETVRVHSLSVLRNGPLVENGQFYCYYAMSRNTANGTLLLWDVNRVPICSFLLANELADFKIEHRSMSATIGKSRYTVKCYPRTASVLKMYGEIVQRQLMLKIQGKSYRDEKFIEICKRLGL